MRKPNYRLDKRQKELAKQKKKEEKRLRKLNKRGLQVEDASPTTGQPAE